MVDYFSFEDVMKELELGEEELKRMVSEGELRAFRDENKMKFKKEDVENLKKGRITEPTIILPSTPATDKTDETVLDLDIGAETESLSDTSTSEPTIALTEGDAVKATSDSDDDLIVTEPTEAGMEPEETFIEEETTTGLSTEPLKLADDATSEETIEAETLADDTETAEEIAAPRRRGTRMSRRISAQAPVAVEEEIEKKRANPIWTFFLLITIVVASSATFFYYDMIRMETGASDRPMSVTGGISKWVLGQFWGDAAWTKHHETKYPENGTRRPPVNEANNRLLQYPDAVYKGASFEIDDAPPAGETVR